jgi:adenosylhomocysteine nucleosidase
MSLKIGIVSAMEREISPLLKSRSMGAWRRGTIQDGPRSYDVWRSATATYIASGIGRGPGVLATRALVASERPDILISAGFAGALTRDLSVGETVTPGTVIDGPTDERFSTQGGEGLLVSAAIIVDEGGKKQLGLRYGADAVDMEGAAVARVAFENGIPFCAVKTISDELEFAMPPFNAYVTPDGKLALDRFAAHVAVRPSYWPSLMQLARNAKKASLELSAALEHLVITLSEKNKERDLRQALLEVGSARPVN